MLIVHKVGPSAVAYYLRDLDEGRWTGSGTDDLDLSGTVGPGELRRVLQGRHPRSGRFLPQRKPARRRGGWDLIFAAPKSVSIMATRTDRGEEFRSAHEAAVDSVLGYIERHLLTVVEDGTPSLASGAIAAVFDHSSNAAGEPHLHSHAILANLGRSPGGTWRSIGGGQWKVERRRLEALYQLELRHRIGLNRLGLDWRLRIDGFADLAEVPRSAIRATSTQSRASIVDGPFRARSNAVPARWRGNLAAERFDPEAIPLQPGHPATPGRETSTEALGHEVTGWLAARRSGFTLSDVISALSARLPAGMPAAEAHTWASDFCRSCRPLSAARGGQRWTTSRAAEADGSLTRLLHAHADGSPATSRNNRALGVRETASAIAEGAEKVVVLSCEPGRSNLVSHSEVVEAIRVLGAERGGARDQHSVVVDSPTNRGRLRWRVLAGVSPYTPSASGATVIVDQAGRRSTADLLATISMGLRRGNRFVLVEGGTFPHLSWPHSAGLTEFADSRGRVSVVARPWTMGVHTEPPLTPASGREAGSILLSGWHEHSTDRRPPVLMGLGPEEVDALNRGARQMFVSEGRLTGPTFRSGGVDYRSGDRVVVTRAGQLGGRGQLGSVVHVDPVKELAAVKWDRSGRTASVDRHEAGSLAYGYAVTASLAKKVDAPLLAFAPAAAIPTLQERILIAAWSGGLVERGRDLRVAIEREIVRGRYLDGPSL